MHKNNLVSNFLGLALLAFGGLDSAQASLDCAALFVPVTQQDQDKDEQECWEPGSDALKGYAKGLSCKLRVDFVRPTQPAVGMTAVNCKRDKLVQKSESKLDKYLRKGRRVVPTVIGPDGNFYITDHHHLSTGVYQTLQAKPDEQPDIRLYAQIVGNFFADQSGPPSTEQMAAFWAVMQSCNNAYLSYLGQLVEWTQMPSGLAAMEDDPYRTLSRWVRDADGFIKPSVSPANFLEFTWADKFRLDLNSKYPLCAMGASVDSPACQLQIQQMRSDLDMAMGSARAYDSVQWIQEGNCASDLHGNPQALVACGYNPVRVDVDVDKYITADRGCETNGEYSWEKITDAALPRDTLSWFQYAQGHVTESYQICRVPEDGVFYAGVFDPQSGNCFYVDDEDDQSTSKDFDALTGVQGMYLWSPYTEAIAESGDDFFDDAIPVGNDKKSSLGRTYLCAAGDRIGWVKRGKQKCHLSSEGLHVPFSVLIED